MYSRGRAPLREVVAVMLKLGTIAFGGPAVHVAMLREETVQRYRWLTDEEFLSLFGTVSVLPGPTSTQLAIVLSRRRAGWRGLIVGGLCFIAPAVGIVLGLSWAYVRYRATTPGQSLLYGVEPAVVSVVLVAFMGLARSAIKRWWLSLVAAAAVACYFLSVSVLLVLLVAGVLVAVAENAPRTPRGSSGIALFTFAGPFGRSRPTLDAIAAEFTKLGFIVFGSGYVLLAFVRKDLVSGLRWLSLREVLDAVAAGQVTPGPVFSTATFLGYLLRGVPGALVATAAIFVPSFVLVALVEPLVPRIRRSVWLKAGLDGVVVAALGLMAGVTFDLARKAVVDPRTTGIALISLAVLLRWRPSPVWIVVAGGCLGAFGRLI